MTSKKLFEAAVGSHAENELMTTDELIQFLAWLKNRPEITARIVGDASGWEAETHIRVAVTVTDAEPETERLLGVAELMRTIPTEAEQKLAKKRAADDSDRDLAARLLQKASTLAGEQRAKKPTSTNDVLWLADERAPSVQAGELQKQCGDNCTCNGYDA